MRKNLSSSSGSIGIFSSSSALLAPIWGSASSLESCVRTSSGQVEDTAIQRFAIVWSPQIGPNSVSFWEAQNLVEGRWNSFHLVEPSSTHYGIIRRWHVDHLILDLVDYFSGLDWQEDAS
ncbi:hypothetical protein CsSME_00031656 [Camellia sinensis var. sinensis]